jgi:hypothetical protein
MVSCNLVANVEARRVYGELINEINLSRELLPVSGSTCHHYLHVVGYLRL